MSRGSSTVAYMRWELPYLAKTLRTRNWPAAEVEWSLVKAKLREGLKIDIAWSMPDWLVYWCSIRLISHATVGQYGDTVVPELPAMEALKRWEDGGSRPEVTLGAYPHHDGDFVVIGPECFADETETIICWRGRNYYGESR